MNPLAYRQKDKNKVCLPAKRQRSSTLGIGTVNSAFVALQEKARRHLPPHASLRRAKLGVFARESAKGELESKSNNCKSTDIKIQKVCLFRRWCEVLCRSHEHFQRELKICVVILNSKIDDSLKQGVIVGWQTTTSSKGCPFRCC